MTGVFLSKVIAVPPVTGKIHRHHSAETGGAGCFHTGLKNRFRHFPANGNKCLFPWEYVPEEISHPVSNGILLVR
jgi:hypothetical protein